MKKDQEDRRFPFKKGLMEIIDQLGSNSPAGGPESQNDLSQTERDEKIVQIYQQLLLLEGSSAVRIASHVLWFVVIFQILTAVLEHLRIINSSPFINNCQIGLPLVGGLRLILYGVYLFWRGIPGKPVRQCLIMALALLGNAALFYYQDFLTNVVTLILGLQFGGK
ncbi:hypothetical protein SAMN05216327_106379 [Dyadobacter sp. SG02]|uniref:hypothetical protein n=1 Tax=Dyadobacter sp. SG02 TaxID=1855291 RepID=UPI0008B15547|nr:hypothetical protein [Dyadobacter sp. SG02]SEJ15599.1 hypothetical protein SAMN05216327_106379 [Dyadobacter sp. SG02]